MSATLTKPVLTMRREGLKAFHESQQVKRESQEKAYIRWKESYEDYLLYDPALPPKSEFSPQSGEEGQSVAKMSDMSTQQITAFADQDAGWTKEASGTYDETMDLAYNTDSNLASFLGRPVRSTAYSWAVGTPFYAEFNPWEEFITNPQVADKIANYELLRCKMHMKIVISGTGFHYGRALVSYNPLTGTYDEVTVTRNFIDQDLVAASQRPHFFLNPTNNEGGELCMPFFFLQNYMSLSKKDYEDMGTVNIKSFGNLEHANGGNDPVTITVYLWATDVVLTMPTSITPSSVFTAQSGFEGQSCRCRPRSEWKWKSKLWKFLVAVSKISPLIGMIAGLVLGSAESLQFEPQSGKGPTRNRNKKKTANAKMNAGDEYGQGIISAPASAISKAAGMLAEIPMIAPYARATEMVAGKIGQVAALFGYSRPAVISDIVLQKPSPTGNLANTDASDAVNRLTLDSKQELTIDSRTTGLDGADQMSLDSIMTRESYLTSFTMSPDNVPDSILWNSYVTPNLYAVNGSEIHATPMAQMMSMFQDWQGSIKFRFQVVKSNFHKGRILVRYDPRSHVDTPSYNTNYSRVVDLAEEDDFEVVVGWGQNRPFLSCAQMNESVVNFGTTRLTTDSNNRHNGILEVNVVNALVSPGLDSSIRINVFVSMCDDYKIGAPTPDKLRNLHYFAPQGGMEPQSGIDDGQAMSGTSQGATDKPTGSEEIQDISSTLGPADHQYEVFYGEAPTTLRELFKRYMFHRSYVTTPPGDDSVLVTNMRIKQLPYASGDDPNGLDLKIDTITPYTQVHTHPIAFWMPCFAGWRGSLRHKFIFNADGDQQFAPVVQRYGFLTSNGPQEASYPTGNVQNTTKFLSNRLGRFTWAGAASTNIGVNNTIEVEGPFYNGTRLATSRIITAPSMTCQSFQVTTLNTRVTNQNVTNEEIVHSYQDWIAAGEDFSLFFFSGVPIQYRYERSELS